MSLGGGGGGGRHVPLVPPSSAAYAVVLATYTDTIVTRVSGWRWLWKGGGSVFCSRLDPTVHSHSPEVGTYMTTAFTLSPSSDQDSSTCMCVTLVPV